MKNILIFLLLGCSFFMQAQHTFSIVAVDPETGEIGSAGATCGDSIIWPGTPGAYLISDVQPGIGAIHTQAWYIPQNQANASTRMRNGMAPADILDYLIDNDVQNDPSRRQYGLIDYNDGQPRAVAYTGAAADDYKDHKTGETYAIQGNILLGPEILDSMEARYLKTGGCLSDKLMAAMQGANVAGADTRCLGEGVSSLSAFLRVAHPDDAADDLTLDINVAGTDFGVEPIDVLQEKYDRWKGSNDSGCSATSTHTNPTSLGALTITPNPVSEILTIELSGTADAITITDSLGRKLKQLKFGGQEGVLKFDVREYPSGTYFIELLHKASTIEIKKFQKL